METEAIQQASISEVIKQVSDAMSGAVKQYGPDAVDLAMMAYRIEAAQQIVFGLVCAIGAIFIAKAYLRLWAWSKERMEDDPANDEMFVVARIMLGIFSVIVCGFSVIGAIQRLIDVSAWIAVFGYPELRVAMKALAAAGMM